MTQNDATRRGRGQRQGAPRRRRRALIQAIAYAIGAALLPFAAAALLPVLSGAWLIATAALAAVQAALFALRAAGKVRRNRSMHAILGVLVALSLVGALFAHRYVRVAGRTYDRRAEAIDMAGTEIQDLDGLSLCYGLRTLSLNGVAIADFDELAKCRGLTTLDVRGNAAVTAQAHDRLAQALPDCAIAWDIPLFGQSFDSTLPETDLTALSLTTDEVASALARYPDRAFRYALDVYGVRALSTDQALDLTGVSIESADALGQYLDLLPAVTRVDLRGASTAKGDMDALVDRYPGIDFSFAYDFYGKKITTEVAELDLRGKKIDGIGRFADYARYLKGVTRLDLRDNPLTISDYDALRQVLPSASIQFTFDMFGVKVNNGDDVVRLNGKKVGSVEAVEAFLPYLPNLKTLEMSGCGIGDEEMAAMRERHADIKVVWTVKFGKFSLRTDATAFSTLLYSSNKYGYTSRTFEPLKYCTDLEALDLGHCRITDLSFLSGLTKIKVLILACNRITDISPLANLRELQYVELFTNKITDFSPLANMEHLLDANLNLNAIKSIEPLLTCTSLQRLWVGGCGLSRGEVQQLSKALPKCRVNTSSPDAPTYGWRVGKRHEIVKKMFRTRVYQPF